METENHYLLYQNGREAMDRGEFRLAIDRLKQSADLHAHYKTFELLGECYLKTGDTTKAILFLAAAAGLANKQPRAHFLLAKALIEISDTSTARTALERAIEINPNYKDAERLLKEIILRPLSPPT